MAQKPSPAVSEEDFYDLAGVACDVFVRWCAAQPDFRGLNESDFQRAANSAFAAADAFEERKRHGRERLTRAAK